MVRSSLSSLITSSMPHRQISRIALFWFSLSSLSETTFRVISAFCLISLEYFPPFREEYSRRTAIKSCSFTRLSRKSSLICFTRATK